MRNFTTIDDIESVAKFPRRGKIHLGIKVPYQKGGETKYRPKEVDYLVCPPEVQEIYGEEPKEVPIALPSNDITEVIPYAFKYWKSGAGLFCKGDGKIANRAMAVKSARGAMFEEIECPGEDCEYYQSKKCNLQACLMVHLPHVDMFSVYQIDTGSWHSVVNVINSLKLIKKQFGRLINLYDPRNLEPILRLGRMSQETHGSGKKETHHVLYVRAEINTALLLEIREELSNPSLLTAPSHRPPGVPKEEFSEKAQKGVDDLFPSPPPTKEAEAPMEEVVDAVPEETRTPADDGLPDGGELPGEDKPEQQVSGGQNIVDLKAQVWEKIKQLKMGTSTIHTDCFAITGDENKRTPNYMNKAQLIELNQYLDRQLAA